MEENGIFRSLSAENLSTVFENSCDGFFLMNENLELCYVNNTMQEWVGCKSGAGASLYDVMCLGENRQLLLQHCDIARSGTPTRFTCKLQAAHQAPRWLEISLQHLPDAKLMGIARDIGEHKQEIERLHYQSTHDPLTGLHNRTEAIHLLRELPAPLPGRERALLIVELQHFNIINDICGLAAGDELLRQVAESIRGVILQRDFAARVGGKKFLVLCNECSLDLAYARAWALRDKISLLNVECNNRRFDIGSSIGFTTIRQDTDVMLAISEADSACHFARTLGFNRIHAYTPNGNHNYRQQEAEWIARIANAFEHERFQLFYQNIQQIEGGQQADEHYEILLRMQDDEGRFITPDEFIPPAEKYNLMPLIDRWVIRTLFARNAAAWRTAMRKQNGGIAQPVTLCCVNISGASLNDDYFPEFLRDQIALHQVPPQAVCFEITETVAVSDLKKAKELIMDLRAIGFRFALDDFGKGMSSFAYLQTLPVDFLKIDGSLVKNIDTNHNDLRMVEAISKLAQGMGIKTIAEYVKNQAVIDMLQRVGVDYVQGFGIHEPEPLL